MTRETGTDSVKLSLMDWAKMAGLIYVPVIAAIGWAVNIDTRMSVAQTKMDVIREALESQAKKYDQIEERLRAVERRP